MGYKSLYRSTYGGNKKIMCRTGMIVNPVNKTLKYPINEITFMPI